MDYEDVTASDFGKSLAGLGINLLVRDVEGLAVFLEDVFGVKAHRVTKDFAIATYGGSDVFQLHADHTYHSNALPSLLPENGPRGGGVEIRLYETDPDDAVERAKSHSHQAIILSEAENKPHGLREAIIVCENGYAWLPSRRLSEEEITMLG